MTSKFKLPEEFINPPNEFSLMPFWFLNDRLDEKTIKAQLDDFQAHGVDGFVIHPRVGLPRDLGWMSPGLLGFYDLIIAEAKRRGMYVVLYDEGMYPSGSSHGQVVRENPGFAVQSLGLVELTGQEMPKLSDGQTLITTLVHPTSKKRYAVVQQPSGSKIRGLHFVEPGEENLPDAGPGRGSEPKEDEPPAADILNPDAVDSFIRHVYQKFADRYRDEFGKTILAIFTDEPSAMARYPKAGVKPGSKQTLDFISGLLGYDISRHLLSLWFDDVPDAQLHRKRYQDAIYKRIEQTYYARLHAWCQKNNIALTGHPPHSDDIGPLRHFDMPGQDLVWRYVVPGPSATEGSHATMGKCSSSAMIHLKRRRNTNELLGAYGHELTWLEMVWLTNWCLVRGVNLLYPHAFYYSVRGPRKDERPPDVGPNSPWWNQYKPYADAARRLCWLNTDSTHVCRVAVLAEPNILPWRAAKTLQEHQIDFNYLETRHMTEDARVSSLGVEIAGMHYDAVIIDGDVPDTSHLPANLKVLADAGRVIHFQPETLPSPAGSIRAQTAPDLLAGLDRLTGRDVTANSPSPDLRVRHVRKAGLDWYLFFNESTSPIPLDVRVPLKGKMRWIDPLSQALATESESTKATPNRLAEAQLLVLCVQPA